MSQNKQNQSHAPLRLVVLISGFGSNLQAIIDAIAIGKLNAKIAAVISNKQEAFGLERAKMANIDTHVIANKAYNDREAFDAALQEVIDGYQPDLVILAGFMRILGNSIVHHYHGHMINIHPALLPKYPGINTLERVLSASEREHGCSIHFVTEDLDAGPLIAQTRLEVSAEDDVESLGQRLLTLEHKLYPLVIQWFAQGRIRLTDQGPYLDNKRLPKEGYQVDF